MHAAGLFRGHEKPPIQDKWKFNRLEYRGDEKWVLTQDGQILREYDSSDLRISLLYRSRCFESKEAVERFYDGFYRRPMDVDKIFGTLMDDMISKKVVPKGTRVDQFSKVELAHLLLDTYMNYPLPPKSKALFPYNYCMMSQTWTVARKN